MKNLLNISILLIFSASVFSAEIDLSAVDIGDRSRKAVTDMDASLDKLAQQYFEATEKVKADAVKVLEQQRARTKDGLVALGIQHQIELIGKMAPPIDLLGNPIRDANDITGDYGDFRISAAGNKLVLLEKSTNNSSTDYLLVGSLHVFHWSNANDAMVVSKTASGIEVKCYSKFFNSAKLDSKVKFDGYTPVWTKTGDLVK